MAFARLKVLQSHLQSEVEGEREGSCVNGARVGLSRELAKADIKSVGMTMFNPQKLRVLKEGETDITQPNMVIPPKVRGEILKYFDQIEHHFDVNGYSIAEVLPGPLHDIGQGKHYETVQEVLREIMVATNEGSNHLLWQRMQDRYCNGSKTANFVLPVISFTRNNVRPPILTSHVILADPVDCASIARRHVKKMPDQEIFLANGVLSNTNLDQWKEQRAHLNEVFLPQESLVHLMPISVARAEKANAILKGLASGDKSGTVQINEFLLNETMAQLMLALFGLDDDTVEQYNKKVRNSFAVALEATGGAVGGAKEKIDTRELFKANSVLFEFLGKFLELEQRPGVSEHFQTGCPMHGPLTARIQDISDSMEEKYFNAATFLFAGHDTTANTMSWLLYECCKKPEYQDRLREESDRLFAKLQKEGRKLAYNDLHELPFMTRCITETLRLWPVVPNGTFREIQFDDYIKGPNGDMVKLPKGTYVQVTNWMRHRSEELWGPDALVFNPDRDFKDDELWNGKAFAAYNPSTERFSPFTFGPRDCMGKNFAQMEMRVILAYLFHQFTFELASPTKEADTATFLGVNRATLGPRDTGMDESASPQLALYLKVSPR